MIEEIDYHINKITRLIIKEHKLLKKIREKEGEDET